MATPNLSGSRSKSKRRHIDSDPAVSSDEDSVPHIDSWPRFLVIEGVDGEPLKINPFVVSKSIEGICGTVQNVTRLRSGSLLVECARRQQSQNLLQAHHFADTEIVVSVHKTLNSCRGIVRDYAKCLSDMSEDEIAAELKNQGVTSVKRFSRKDGDTFIKTNTYLFTFALTKLPSSIKAGYFNIGVDVYIPNPLRCFKCQQFGHGAKSCRNKQVCSRCSQNHDGTECTESIKCANCSGEHMSFSKSCPSFVRQTKILKIKYSNDISFADAKKLLEKESSPSTLSYSAAVSSSTLKVDHGKANKQQKKKSKALKHTEVPSTLTAPLEVHNSFEPLDMEVTPSLPLQHRGPSPRSRSPIEPP
ncbi:uncharacterized protein LOC125379948 [Haliotis rufescens]|uniref:uncharacterized protein LOC125379948 n=1 Tax=Haliotis rufescens TaxID=6454 RepID=UPI00201F9F73|nr:uncharacterized protein LOC125379948 [Haliotis rufescens]